MKDQLGPRPTATYPLILALVAGAALSTGCGSGGAAPKDCSHCDDGDACTVDACDPVTHTCTHGHGAIAAGSSHTCALNGNGEVRCWGTGALGELGGGSLATPRRTPPAAAVASGIKALGAGGFTTCVVSLGGGLRCWGIVDLSNQYPEASDELLSNVDTVAVGLGHACALTAAGGVRCWGANESGQLGDGSTMNRLTPPDADVLTGVKAIAVSFGESCALMVDGGVRCWGHNDAGQLGDGSTTDRATPPSADVMAGARAIAVGFGHACALTERGGVRCWGANESGQLGDGSTTNRNRPETADVLTDVRAIAAGWNHTCALTNGGSVRCWGSNSNGQLGHGPAAKPQDVEVLAGAEAIAAGDYHTCALLTDGGIRCWGEDTDGQLGDGVTTAPVLSGVKSVAVTNTYTCAVMETGGVRCWGHNLTGQLGNGSLSDVFSPPATDVFTGAQAIAAGDSTDGIGYPTGGHACALTTAGGVRCWGNNSAGQLGNGTFDQLTRPPANDVLAGVQALATGDAFTCALTMAGGVRCWGDNGAGQLGDPGSHDPHPTPPAQDVLSGAKAIAAGDAYTCAVTTGGGVRCWGYNGLGQLGDGTTTSTNAPPARDVVTDVQAIATGFDHACALMTSGGVRCWGDNSAGELGIGTTGDPNDFGRPPTDHDVLTGVKAIAAGVHFTCALMTTGGVRCWGWNSAGQLGDGTMTTRPTPPTEDTFTGIKSIAAGWFHACAVRENGDLICWPFNDTITSKVPSTELRLCSAAN